jgi:YidC/Oxa1 family membrane protein insertase
LTALSQLVGWVLAGFYSLVPNFAVAIILLGLTFMLLVVPLTLKSTRSMLAMQRLQPKMKQLQQQHKDDRLALNQALTQLYKEEGVSPFGSCLPTLLPLPLFYVLYRVIQGLGNAKCTGKGADEVCRPDPLYISHKTRMYQALVSSPKETASQIQALGKHGAEIHAFGMNFATSAWEAVSKHLGAGEVFGTLLLLLVMIAANYYQQIQITNLNPMVRQSQQANPQMQIMRIFPVIFGLICVRLPAGLVLYYSVSAIFRVCQQWLMYRYDPKVKALVAKDDRDLEVLEAKLEETERSQPKAPPPAKQQSAGRPPAKSGQLRRPTQPARTPLSGNGQVRQPARYPTSTGSGGQRNRNRRRRGR